MPKRMTGNEYRTVLVCVDGCREDAPEGRLYSAYCDHPIPFSNAMQFLLEMEKLLNSMNFPQPFEMTRSFRPIHSAENALPEAENDQQCGKLATFAVRVLFRQNASWQGSVAWLGKKREESFRSALELLMLMHSAFTAQLSAPV